MAEYIIDKIEYGGNVYKLQDNVSDFLTGAVTSLSTTAGEHSTITNQNGAVSIAIPTNMSHLTDDVGFLKTSYGSGNTTLTITPSTANNSASLSIAAYNYTSGSTKDLTFTIGSNGIEAYDVTAEVTLFKIEPYNSGNTGYISIHGVKTPTDNLDAVNKKYVDDAVGAIVTDDKTWNGVSLNKQSATAQANQMVPILSNVQATTANLLTVSSTPTAYCIPKYDGYNYLYSTTPSTNDNSTKVATTAYVDSALSTVETTAVQIIRW